MLREQTAASPERMAAALKGLRAYQEAPRPQPGRLAPARYRKGRVRLRDYGGPPHGRPVVVVPSLINPPFILDLAPDVSLMRWLASRGFRSFLLDWRSPTPADRTLDLTGHVERLLLPLLARFDAPPLLVGYCLGGTLAMAAAALGHVVKVATIAAPWRFGGFGRRGRADIAELWAAARPACQAMGLVPMEVLQTGFWRLDPERTIRKYERFAGLDLASDAAAEFIRLEDWANAGAPLPYAVGAQLFERFVAEDQTGHGRWRVGGVTVDPARLPCPALEFVSLTDRIVPAATAAGLPDRRELGAGHVGMIIGRGARRQLWEPLADWLAEA